MTLDPQKLLNFPIPSVRQTVTPRDAAFYALSIGMGRDPTDLAQLQFVDPLCGPIAMPGMALVLAHPGFWLGLPDSGVDPVAVLHASQSMLLLGPVPAQGEVESTTRVTHLVDKGAGKPALIFTETDIRDDRGTCFARLERTIFIRGGGGFGGDAHGPQRAPLPVPEGEPGVVIDLPTGPEQALIYRLNGDLNPLHSDPAVAARAGLRAPILHGLCTMGVIIHAVLRGRLGYRTEGLRSVQLRFAAPVFPGETIRTEIWNNGAFRASVLERDVIVADQGFFTISQDDGDAVS
ncbi:MaoC family dehydratase [Novosphingobium mangrovi (ex Huang et al. 2023)]|uniref:MaoC/PaaZ C-terminal domain-containing protein n=1 Tax=Novosphingobium mangrovi (ex Huang et al. 2023) TaxID=2976432 RepID=A0ABT2IB01_9SPHN|nr:MaoC family dehydratase [Novosphingobium mangrovi (ex Huang et al. 2023)]MCT2402010.1 MaoC/PaaZ C-terminal domain-containing protein [Novosphingobium mangrovi (ex Huang et al. 2023)]